MGGMCKTTSMYALLIPPVYMAWGVGLPEVGHPEMAFECASFPLASKLFFHLAVENLSLDCVALLLSRQSPCGGGSEEEGHFIANGTLDQGRNPGFEASHH